MKRCKGDCDKEKPLDSFSGTRNYCKVCRNAKRKRKRDADKQDKDKTCTGCGELLPGIKFNKGWTECKVCAAKRMKQRRQADKRDRPKVCKGKWSCGELLPGDKFHKGKSKCKECHRKRQRTQEYKETVNARIKKRRKEDPQYAMRCRLRSRIKQWLKGKIKSAPTAELVGCTEKVCNEWLESQFLPGMTWENQHLWHIDHMKPLDSFDALDPAEQRKACHYTNLQPLWAKDNFEQSNKDIYDMEWRDHWYIKLGDEYVSRKEQVKKGISTHKYYPLKF